jgi:flagellar hook-length control protein FliK
VLAEAAIIALPEGDAEPTEETPAPEKVTENSSETDAVVVAATVTIDVATPVATPVAAVAAVTPLETLPAPAAEDSDVAPVDLDAAASAAPATPATPALPADVPETPAQDAPESAKQPATADAAPAKPAPEAAKAESKAAPAQETPKPDAKPAAPAAQAAVETPAPKALAPQDHKSDKADKAEKTEKSKGTQHGVRAASDNPAPRESVAPATEVPAEQPVKPATQHQHATERPLAAAPAPSEGRSENAPGAPAPVTISAVTNTAPVVPFHLAAQPILPTVSPLTALRIEAGADNAVPIAGLAVEIVARSQDGAKRFEIRLDPPELGRIDVRLDVDQTGKVTSRLVIERADTLDLLRRDAPQLERALQHAGLNTEGGLEFSLRDQSFANRDQQRDGTASRLIIPEDEPAAAEAARRGYGRMIGLGGGVDIRV